VSLLGLLGVVSLSQLANFIEHRQLVE